jgi:glycosyltransferase involved in cell wall biosynthesis
MKVDIVIPVHNRAELTKQTIDSLYTNTDHDLFNLYVIDDVSDDETKRVLRDLQATYRFKLFTNDENIGPAASRNEVCEYITLKEKRQAFLYHSDNDVFFTQGWLNVLLVMFPFFEANYRVKLLGGGCHPYLQNNETIDLNQAINTQGQNRLGIKDAVSGYSQLMTWETWDKYGPFSDNNRNEDIKIMGSEDWAFCQEIIKDGFKVGSIEPEVVIACGKTNTYGNPATGSETFKKFEGVKVL